jgi:hypothetical protein
VIADSMKDLGIDERLDELDRSAWRGSGHERYCSFDLITPDDAVYGKYFVGLCF